MNRRFQLILGALFWLAVVAFAYAATRPDEEGSPSPKSSLAQYLAGPADEIEMSDHSRLLRRHDPVFFQSPEDGSWRQVGYVTETLTPGDGDGGSGVSTPRDLRADERPATAEHRYDRSSEKEVRCETFWPCPRGSHARFSADSSPQWAEASEFGIGRVGLNVMEYTH